MIKKILKKTSIPLVICILSVILLNTYIVLSIYSQNQIAKNSFRFHIVANSNNTNDQIIKLRLSEKIQAYINNITKNLSSKQDIINTVNSNLQNILKITNDDLKNENINYTAYAKIGKILYNEKVNQEITMPEGTYDSLQIVLGKGEGKNFWSLIFPNKENIDKLKDFESILPGISKIYNDENSQDVEGTDEITYSFKIVELFKELF